MTFRAVDQLTDIPGTEIVIDRILEDNITVLEEIRKSYKPDAAKEKQEEAFILILMEDNWLKRGNNNKALATYQNSHDILKQLAQENPKNTE